MISCLGKYNFAAGGKLFSCLHIYRSGRNYYICMFPPPRNNDKRNCSVSKQTNRIAVLINAIIELYENSVQLKSSHEKKLNWGICIYILIGCSEGLLEIFNTWLPTIFLQQTCFHVNLKKINVHRTKSFLNWDRFIELNVSQECSFCGSSLVTSYF